jgi:hypothetical protein
MSRTGLGRPSETEYASFYAGYVSLVPETDVLRVLEEQVDDLRRYAAAVPPERERFRYAPEKWSVRELFGHVADAERVFGYRALCIGRGERGPLPGFDEKEYVAQSRLDEFPLQDHVADFAAMRRANVGLLSRFDATEWGRSGTANNSSVSVRALAFIMAGHVRHHLGILRSRYGLSPG